MKIAFAVPAYWPSVIGVSLYCQELAEGLVKRGHDVVVFTGAYGDWPKEENRNGVVIKRITRRHFGRYYTMPSLADEIVKEKPDIVHSHHYGYYEATAGLRAAKKLGVPHVFGPYYHPPIYGLKRKLLAKAYHWRYGKPLLRESDIILPHTEYEKGLFLKIGGRAEAMRLLPNTVDTKVFKPGTRKAKIVLFVSNLIEEKGAGVAMDLAQELLSEKKDLRFVFRGGAHDDSLKAKIAQLSKNPRVSFLGSLPEHELAKLYSKAAVVILPSRYEAFSKVLAEAQACGTPVVATRVGGIPEVVRDGETGFLVDYGDWEALKEKVELLLDNSKLAQKMGREARKHIVESFDTKKIVDRLEEIYEELV
jgi:glycosyltransferase involved in cell wall biosynthesis